MAERNSSRTNYSRTDRRMRDGKRVEEEWKEGDGGRACPRSDVDEMLKKRVESKAETIVRDALGQHRLGRGWRAA
jgi:hypothetical protein